ncbi:hypothetical protein B484DRAFT_390593, partial [Ochromonadaceae sp. CCMP2298]
GEIASYQDAVAVAHANYERELQMHAAAERELSEVRGRLGAASAALAEALKSEGRWSGECIRHEAALAEEKRRWEGEAKDLTERMAGLQHINDLMQSQVQVYGQQMQRIHEQRLLTTGVTTVTTDTAVEGETGVGAGMEGVGGVGAEESKEPTTASTTTTTGAGVGAGVGAGTGAGAGVVGDAVLVVSLDVEEYENLIKMNSDLREVARYNKRDK